jgi:hypothetical protein
MLKTQEAILKYLTDGMPTYTVPIRTIKKYRGEIARAAIQEEKVRKFADPLPAVYVTMIDGHPISYTPDYNFDLLVITESRTFDIEKKEVDNLEVIDAINSYIQQNSSWKYNNTPYEIDREKVKVKTLLSDSRFIIIAVSLYIKNLSDNI